MNNPRVSALSGSRWGKGMSPGPVGLSLAALPPGMGSGITPPLPEHTASPTEALLGGCGGPPLLSDRPSPVEGAVELGICPLVFQDNGSDGSWELTPVVGGESLANCKAPFAGGRPDHRCHCSVYFLLSAHLTSPISQGVSVTGKLCVASTRKVPTNSQTGRGTGAVPSRS